MTSRLGVHGSVSAMFPPEALAAALDGVDAEVRVVGSSDRRDDGTGGEAGHGGAETRDDGAGTGVERGALGDCDALVTFAFDEAFLDAEIGWIHSTQAGVDRLPLDVLEAHGVAVTSSNGVHGEAVGETVAGYMLAFARGLHRFVRSQAAREWADPAWDAAFTLAGGTACVVGLGTLGRGIAQRADALGMDVVGVRRTPTPVGHVRRVYQAADLREAIADARVVALAVPLTDETESLIGADELAAMREDAYLVNVARGAVVDEAALVEALDGGEIAGAALDVFETEPLPPDSPLWGMENVIVTPHEASDGRGKHEHVAALVRENHRRFLAGEALANRLV